MFNEDIEAKFKKWYESRHINANADDKCKPCVTQIMNKGFKKIEIREFDNIIMNLKFILNDIDLSLYINTNASDTVKLLGHVCFNKLFGGRIGYVHGAGSFTILFIIIGVYVKLNFSGRCTYSVLNIKYFKPIEIDRYVNLKLEHNHSNNTILSIIENNNSEVYVTLEAKLTNLNKF
jgi:hypothetical protein